jgi:hypothetical protein
MLAATVVCCSGLVRASVSPTTFDMSVTGLRNTSWLALFRIADLLLLGMVITAAAVGLVILTAAAATGERRARSAGDDITEAASNLASEVQEGIARVAHTDSTCEASLTRRSA